MIRAPQVLQEHDHDGVGALPFLGPNPGEDAADRRTNAAPKVWQEFSVGCGFEGIGSSLDSGGNLDTDPPSPCPRPVAPGTQEHGCPRSERDERLRTSPRGRVHRHTAPRNHLRDGNPPCQPKSRTI